MRNFATAKDAALRFGWNYNTYSQHERGHSGITRAAKDYARAFKVSEAWLLTGEGSPEDAFAGQSEELREVFTRLADAPPAVQARVLSVAKALLEDYEQSRNTATTPTS